MVPCLCELWFNIVMHKAEAIDLLGGTVAAAAGALGVSYQAVAKWPEHLPERIGDRVIAVWVRRHLADRLPPVFIQKEVRDVT